MSNWALSTILEPNFDGGILKNKHLIGGVRIVKSKAQRNAIPYLYRSMNTEETTLCYVENDGQLWRLTNNPLGVTSDSDWTLVTFGSVSTFQPVGTWDPANLTPVLSDAGAAGRNGEFYFVTGSPTSQDVTISGLFGDETVTVVDGNLIVSVGSQWVVVASSLTWDSISKPSVIEDYVNGIVQAHTHTASEITDLATYLSDYITRNDTVDSTTTWAAANNTDIPEVSWVKANIYNKTEVNDLLSDLGDGSTNFLDLTDTPDDYTGASNWFVRVKSDLSGLEFAEVEIPPGNPFADDTALIKNSVDQTKLAIFSAIGISTGTTRTYVLPNSNGTLLSTGESYADPAWITSLAASKITGTLDISNIPAAALERVYVYGGVQTLPENAGLTTTEVQNGDVVKMNSTGLMYIVVNDAALNNSASYVVFNAGTAASVPWTGITGKPTTLAGYAITDQIYLRGGNAFAAASILGLTDNFDLTIQTGNANIILTTNSAERFRINSEGLFTARRIQTGVSAAPIVVSYIVGTSTTNMSDDFGPTTNYQIRDDAGVDNDIVRVGGVRNGADNSGAFVVYTAKTGTFGEKLRVDFEGVLSSTRMVTSTNSIGRVQQIKLQTSADMDAGYGPVTVYQIRDNAGVDRDIVYIGAVRGASDNTGDFVLYTSNAGSVTEKVRVTSGGNMGVNVSAPLAAFHLASTTLTTDARALMVSHHTTDSIGSLIDMRKSRGASITSPTTVADDDAIGGIIFTPYVTTTGWMSTAAISAIVNGTVSGTSAPTDLIFRTSNVAVLGTDIKLRITSGSTIGIGDAAVGDTSAGAQLHVGTNAITSTSRGILISQHDSASTNPLLAFRKSRTSITSPTAVADGDGLGNTLYAAYLTGSGGGYVNTASIVVQVNGTVTSTLAPTDFLIRTSDQAVTTADTRFRITSTGLSGFRMGTGIPTAVVHVKGRGTSTLETFKLVDSADASIFTVLDNKTATISGVWTAPTAALNTNTTQIATTAFVQQEIDATFGSGTIVSNAITWDCQSRRFSRLNAGDAGANFTITIINPSQDGVFVFRKTIAGDVTVTLSVSGYTMLMANNGWSAASQFTCNGDTNSYFRVAFEKVGTVLWITNIENWK
jgi:hypothetical protein